MKKNIFAVLLLILSFILIMLFSSLGLWLKSDNTYILYFIFVLFASMMMGIHWSFLSFHTSCIADINYAEKTKYGHVCLLAL